MRNIVRTRIDAGAVRRLAVVGLTVVAGALLVSCGGGGAGGGGDGGGGDVTFDATEFDFDPPQATAQAGEITATIDNQGEQRHTWTVEDHEDALKLDANAGQTDTGTIELDAGTYTFYCDIPGHREAGMEGTLTVEGS